MPLRSSGRSTRKNAAERLITRILTVLAAKPAGAVFLAILATMGIYFAVRPPNLWSDDHKFAIGFGIAISAVTAAFIEVFPGVISYLGQWSANSKFVAFFGEVTKETRGALLVFSHRTLRDDVCANDIWKTLPETDGINLNGAVPEGMNGWVALQDLRGANYIAGELAKRVQQTSYFRTDLDLIGDPIDQIRATVFSF